jgi:hypothetical protein
MTKAQFHTAVKIELDKTSSLDLPAFEPEEIDYWLDQAILRFVEGKYNDYISGTDISKLQDELKNLLVHETSLTVAVSAITTLGRGKIFRLTFDAGLPLLQNFILDLSVSLTSKVLEDGTTQATVWQRCKQINSSEIDKYISTYFNTPYFEQPFFYISNSTTGVSGRTLVDVITDYFTTAVGTAAAISYLKTPTTMASITPTSTEYTDLPSHTHYNVVKLAVMMMLENIESPRIQTNPPLVNNNL